MFVKDPDVLDPDHLPARLRLVEIERLHPCRKDKSRKAQADMMAVTGLLAMNTFKGGKTPEGTIDEIEGIYNNLLFYDEHTFGAAESIWDPTCWNSQIQFQSKGAFSWTAQRDARLLMETAAGYLQSYVNHGDVPTITLFNPLAWQRDSYAEVYIDEVVVPRNHDFKICDEEGNEVLHQYLRSRNEGSYYALYAKDVPALGYRNFWSASEPGAAANNNINDMIFFNGDQGYYWTSSPAIDKDNTGKKGAYAINFRGDESYEDYGPLEGVKYTPRVVNDLKLQQSYALPIRPVREF